MAANITGTEEEPLESTYCVVYRLEDQDWVVTGQGWAQVQLLRDRADHTCRVVGWTVQDYKVVINANVTADCKYKKKSADFHKFTDEFGVVYGFGFFQRDDAIAESKRFMNAVLDVIGEQVNQAKIGPPLPPPRPPRGKPQPHNTHSPSPPPLPNGRASPNTAVAGLAKIKPPALPPQRAQDKPKPKPKPKAAGTEGTSGGSVMDRIKRLSAVHLPQPGGRGPAPRPHSSAETKRRPPHVSAEAKRSTARRERSVSSAVVNPTTHRGDSKDMDDYFNGTVAPMGKLKILPPKKARKASTDESSESITDPFGVFHTQHVKYDASTRTYEGLPPGWEQQLKKQFGLMPNQVETVVVDGYRGRIPAVLVQMKEYLVSQGGYYVEGIFRLAPDQDECKFVKRQLEENTFQECADINCIANLIKVWFRELPVHVLDGLDRSAIVDTDTPERASEMVESMAEPNRSIMEWLLDLMVEVQLMKDTNKMTAQNMAIVVGPNLFSPTPEMAINPLIALEYSQKVAAFVNFAVKGRILLWQQQGWC